MESIYHIISRLEVIKRNSDLIIRIVNIYALTDAANIATGKGSILTPLQQELVNKLFTKLEK